MIYLLDKPAGWTSFDLVKKVRGITGEKKVGHAGTLDPLATGLMIVGTGPDTKTLTNIIAHKKSYRAEFLLGRSTTTADQEGEVIAESCHCAQELDPELIKQSVKSIIGIHQLPVPLYSAVKVNGQPLYWYARNNVEPPELPVRDMEVLSVDLISVDSHELGQLVTLELLVASGVYIRSIAEYVGEILKVPSMMWELRRDSIEDFKLVDAITLSELEQLVHSDSRE